MFHVVGRGMRWDDRSGSARAAGDRVAGIRRKNHGSHFGAPAFIGGSIFAVLRRALVARSGHRTSAAGPLRWQRSDLRLDRRNPRQPVGIQAIGLRQWFQDSERPHQISPPSAWVEVRKLQKRDH